MQSCVSFLGLDEGSTEALVFDESPSVPPSVRIQGSVRLNYIDQDGPANAATVWIAIILRSKDALMLKQQWCSWAHGVDG